MRLTRDSHNGIFILNILFRVCITDCRRLPVFIQSFTYLFLLHDHLPCGMDHPIHLLPYAVKM